MAQFEDLANSHTHGKHLGLNVVRARVCGSIPRSCEFAGRTLVHDWHFAACFADERHDGHFWLKRGRWQPTRVAAGRLADQQREGGP